MKRVQTGDPQLQMLQDNVAQALNQSASIQTVTTDAVTGKPKIARSQGSSPYSGGNVIVQALVAGQDNLVAHGLSRLPQYWSVVRQDTNATVWETKTSALQDKNGNAQSANANYLNLHCSANCNVSVWVS